MSYDVPVLRLDESNDIKSSKPGSMQKKMLRTSAEAELMDVLRSFPNLHHIHSWNFQWKHESKKSASNEHPKELSDTNRDPFFKSAI
jgi:hypothetical protein